MNKKYLFAADVVRFFAIVGAIGVHIVITVSARPDFFGGKIWWLTFLLNCLFRTCVPLFVILSGYLGIGKNLSPGENFRKVWRKIFVPLIVYYILFNVVYATMAYLRNEPFDYAGIFHNLSKNTHTPLYFLVVLGLVQLLNPVWDLLSAPKNRQILKYICRLFLGLAVVAFIFYYLSLREGEVFGTFTYWILWIGYYLYGYLVKTKSTQFDNKERRFYLMSFGLGYVLTVGLGYLMLGLHHAGKSDLFYIGGQTYADGYLSFSVMMMALSLFNLMIRQKHKLLEVGVFKKTIKFVAGISFAMYLNHLFILDTMVKFFGVTPDSPGMRGIAGYLLVSTVLTFGITIVLVYLAKRVWSMLVSSETVLAR